MQSEGLREIQVKNDILIIFNLKMCSDCNIFVEVHIW